MEKKNNCHPWQLSACHNKKAAFQSGELAAVTSIKYKGVTVWQYLKTLQGVHGTQNFIILTGKEKDGKP